MDDKEATLVQRKASGEADHPRPIRIILLWISGTAAVIIALTGLMGNTRQFINEASWYYNLAKSAFSPSCNDDLTLEEKIGCEK